MKQNSFKKMLSVIACLVLIAALALNFAGCGNNESTLETTVSPVSSAEMVSLGEGASMFYFIAVDLEGIESKFEIHTDAATVGEALLEHELIAGDAGDYGMYVKTVNGITLDWDKDAKYWSLLIDGEYAMTGVDQTEISDGTTYTFVPAS